MGARGRPSSTSLSRDKSTGSPEECSEGRGLVLPASLATLGRLCSRRRRLFRAARVRRQPHAVGQTRARSRPRGCGAAAPPFPARLPALGSSLHPAGPSESSSLREPVSLDPLTGYPAASAFCDVRGRPRAPTEAAPRRPRGRRQPGRAVLLSRAAATSRPFWSFPRGAAHTREQTPPSRTRGWTRTVLGTLEGRPGLSDPPLPRLGKEHRNLALEVYGASFPLTNLH